ncbi:MAG: hypothetical protein Q7S89_01790 [bacterium]|nr:hypothetical protein [bacterium]
MKILFFDPTVDPNYTALVEEGKVTELEPSGRLHASVLDRIENLDGVIVVHGAGRFSRVRGAVSVANALSYGKNISIVGIKAISGETLNGQIARGIEELKINPQKTITPEYGGLPHITKPK